MAGLAPVEYPRFLNLNPDTVIDFATAALSEHAINPVLRFVGLGDEPEKEEIGKDPFSELSFSFAPSTVSTVESAATTSSSTARLAGESPAFDSGSLALVPESPALDGSAAFSVVAVRRDQFPEAMLDPTVIGSGTVRPEASPFDELLAANDAVDPLRFQLNAQRDGNSAPALAA